MRRRYDLHLCAGVTTYKGLKETQARPGEWVVITGVGGLGHVAVQYAKAMGLHVAAVDIGAEKLQLARNLGADVTVDASKEDAPAVIQKKVGGAHGVLVTAVSVNAFKQAIGMLRRGGTCVLCGLPPGEFPVSIFVWSSIATLCAARSWVHARTWKRPWRSLPTAK